MAIKKPKVLKTRAAKTRAAVNKRRPSTKRLEGEELYDKALKYHEKPVPGKIAIVPTKPYKGHNDLSLAYSPGVAFPCLEIEKDPEAAYKYTSKGNLVGIITNGTAVLGLGDIGHLASKPVMEGKAMLFKVFAGIDVFDIEVGTRNSEKFIETVLLMSDTFGAINLEDIAAPDCFHILDRLTSQLNIPVLHDDQSGTAVVVCAALKNALHIQGKKKCDIKLVCLGAGAAGIGVLKLARSYFGFALEQIHLVDSKGLVTVDRHELDNYKLPYAKASTNTTSLADAIKGADVLIGVSTKNILTKQMVLSMAARPIIMAMANPDPEITPEQVYAIRNDAIVATGRSDYPNQVNNSVCFPYLFKGALDARARKFTPAMFFAAVDALADLARKPVPPKVKKLYPREDLTFGRNYILPKQNDHRLLKLLAPKITAAYDEKDISQ